MSTILQSILEAKRKRIADGEFSAKGAPRLPSDGAGFLRAMAGKTQRAGGAPVPILAEIKSSSPSAGSILPDADAAVERIARAYRRGGAAALSVVVEQDFFRGDPAWIPRAKEASGLPILMKDFVLDESQVDFALSLGADAVLLIAAALDESGLARLHAAARSRGLAVLVEAHDEAEIRRALAAGAEIVGVNARDLKTFSVDLEATASLGATLPGGVVRVAESGIRTRGDIEALTRSGYGAFLVGESLLRALDPARALRTLQGLNPTEVKICGVTRPEDLEACRRSGVDWVGLNFSPRSPRRVGSGAAAVLRERSRWAKGVVAVFAGNPEAEIRRVAAAVGPDILQLTEPPAERVSWPLPVWQTVRVGRDDLGRVDGWPGDALLFDSAVEGMGGGTGRTFDWSLLEGAPRGRALVLAGGLNPDNVAAAIRRVRPDVVDSASGVELAPGVKDPVRIASFVSEVRHA